MVIGWISRVNGLRIEEDHDWAQHAYIILGQWNRPANEWYIFRCISKIYVVKTIIKYFAHFGWSNNSSFHWIAWIYRVSWITILSLSFGDMFILAHSNIIFCANSAFVREFESKSKHKHQIRQVLLVSKSILRMISLDFWSLLFVAKWKGARMHRLWNAVKLNMYRKLLNNRY